MCCEGKGLRSLLSGAPRAVLHRALTTGAPLGPAVRQQEAQGVGPYSEDAAIAYQLLLQVGERIDAAQWFEGFCQVYGATAVRGDAAGGGGAAPGGAAAHAAGTQQQQHKGKGGAREVLWSFAKRYKAKKAPVTSTTVVGVLTVVDSPVFHLHTHSLSAPPLSHTQASTEGATRFAALPVEERQAQLRVLAARFSCAVAELQFAGVCRQSKQRRRGVVVQRTMYMPPMLLMGSAQ